jgi:hypothetical protein
MPPELIQKINSAQLRQLEKTVSIEMNAGSPEQRKYQMQLRLLKKLNAKEFADTQKNKRKNPRFAS